LVNPYEREEMKTDKDKLKEMLREFGVGFGEEDSVVYEIDSVVCEVGNSKVEGYAGAITYFNFDKDGKFVGMDIGEI